ncbi:MAG TPA: hypothetical protein VF120_11650 [Ktedonobacterales bacterium]
MSDDKLGDNPTVTVTAKTRKRSGVSNRRQTAVSETTRQAEMDDQTRATPYPPVADLLRAVATSIERNPRLASSLFSGEAKQSVPVIESSSGRAKNVPPDANAAQDSTKSGTKRSRRISASQPANPVLDPFAVLREHGESDLHMRLTTLAVEELRSILRTHRLDPARIASRWSDRERLIALIVEQVRARAGLGRAFERV